jgi:hypothetical protein
MKAKPPRGHGQDHDCQTRPRMRKREDASATRDLWAQTMTNKGLQQTASFATHRLGGRQIGSLVLAAIAVALARALSALILMRFGPVYPYWGLPAGRVAVFRTAGETTL